MPYILEKAICGKVVEVTKKYSYWYGRKKRVQAPREKPTAEKQAVLNRNHAIKKLRRLINTNYGYGDYHIVLTYRKEARPDGEAAKKYLENFLRRMRRVYDAQQLTFKYICVTEYTHKAIHHHLVVNKIEVQSMIEKWPYGRVKVFPLDNTGQYKELAEYLIKETDKTFKAEDALYKKRWNGSRNLEKPKIITKRIKRERWTPTPKPEKGFYIEKGSVYEGIQDFCFYPYQFYSMVRLM